MTDDSTQIAATSPAQRPAHGTMRESVGDDPAEDPPRPNAGRAEEGATLRPEGKFSALQSLEKSQNAEGISIWIGSCAAVSEEAAAEPIVDLSSRGVAVADSAREADVTTESPANGAATS